ncbi:Tetratricopeptide repeat 11 [Babesia ovata]|uniref:Tetratricopeptide repeat 11 n=1 Tax=Babesia ovata TaxID=189622 RepID=A0A2H6KEK7_9APIC|nr:Tetratricopeptide repeat 11 [Babesia ovata]GBE61432.1 Tetratricopeptide repeat 11 [Babesia ovata]
MANIEDIQFEIDRLKQEYEEGIENCQLSAKVQYDYACMLMCSVQSNHINLSIELFEELIRIRYNSAKCMYQLALCHMKKREYKKAKRHLDMLLRLEPRNHAALSLRSLLFDLLSDDAMKGSLFVLMASICAFALYKSWK